jgi:CMP-N,N'-diacetyllegionaminic acid synthase
MVILIPARAGSQRVPNKALKLLGGKPLIQWTIESAFKLALPIYVCSEDIEILRFGELGGVGAWQRPRYTASDDAPDLTWLTLALRKFGGDQEFMIRRPTSPFLSYTTMLRAWSDFNAVPDATAMRAMRPAREHPYKMWLRSGVWMVPPGGTCGGIEACSCPTQVLPRVYVQTAGLEIIRRSTLEAGSLTGDRLLPLFLEGPEALDINTPEDWAEAERICQTFPTT